MTSWDEFLSGPVEWSRFRFSEPALKIPSWASAEHLENIIPEQELWQYREDILRSRKKYQFIETTRKDKKG